MMRKQTLLLLAALCCAPSLFAQSQQIPEAMKKVLAAHGGLDIWKAQHMLTFTKGEGDEAETHTTNLHDRRIRVEAQNHTIGYDGEEVWISPAEAEFRGSPRFYHNLYFYFYAMPFVLADPGIYYSEAPEVTLMGTTYQGIKISYSEGVGDSPDDNYILYYDPVTYQMAWLMYTVTYRSGEPSNQFSLIKYGEWQDVSGLQLPKTITWYTYKNGEIGEERSAATFHHVMVAKQAPEASLFTMPSDAKVSPKQ